MPDGEICDKPCRMTQVPALIVHLIPPSSHASNLDIPTTNHKNNNRQHALVNHKHGSLSITLDITQPPNANNHNDNNSNLDRNPAITHTSHLAPTTHINDNSDPLNPIPNISIPAPPLLPPLLHPATKPHNPSPPTNPLGNPNKHLLRHPLALPPQPLHRPHPPPLQQPLDPPLPGRPLHPAHPRLHDHGRGLARRGMAIPVVVGILAQKDGAVVVRGQDHRADMVAYACVVGREDLRLG